MVYKLRINLSSHLVISTGVTHNEQTRLFESCLDLVGECAWSESSSNSYSPSVAGKLEDGTLPIQKHKIVKCV